MHIPRLILCSGLLLSLLSTLPSPGASTKPEPKPAPSSRQEALAGALQAADRLEIRSPRGDGVLHQVAGKAKLSDLLARIRIVDAESGFHCMCDGDFHLHFHAGEKKLSMIGYHHNRSLRWHRGPWDGDSLLTDESAGDLIEWFSANGFHKPAKQRREKLARKAAERKRKETFINCFKPDSRRHFKSLDLPNLTPTERIALMGRNLAASYDDRLLLLKDICRAYGTRPLPWSYFNIPDQVGKSAANQMTPDWFVKLASAPDKLTAHEKAGFCFLIREHPDNPRAAFAGSEADLCAILAGALEIPIDPGYLSKILLWYANQRVEGAADVIAPFVTGEQKLKFPFGPESFEEDPSPRAIAALALALLGDHRVVAPIASILKKNPSPSPDRSALLLALAHAKGQPELFSLKDYSWDTFLTYEAVNSLARKHPSKHSYDLVIIGGTTHSWAIVNQEAVITFQQLSGQKWFKNQKYERADWYEEEAREWWIKNRDSFDFPAN